MLGRGALRCSGRDRRRRYGRYRRSLRRRRNGHHGFFDNSRLRGRVLADRRYHCLCGLARARRRCIRRRGRLNRAHDHRIGCLGRSLLGRHRDTHIGHGLDIRRSVAVRLIRERSTPPAARHHDVVGHKLHRRTAEGDPAQGLVVDSERGKDAESAAQGDDRGEQRPDQQTDIGKHSTSQHAGARSLKGSTQYSARIVARRMTTLNRRHGRPARATD